MQIEAVVSDTKAGRGRAIVDVRGGGLLRSITAPREPKIAGATARAWEGMRVRVTPKVVEGWMQQGGVPVRIQDEWREGYQLSVREGVDPVVRPVMTRAWAGIEEGIKRMGKADPLLSGQTAAQVNKWVVEQGGKLIVALTQSQIAAVTAVLTHYMTEPITAYQLSQLIRPTVGLTPREAMAIIRFREELIKEGITGEALIKQVNTYTTFLHRNRAFRIARTELANAYGEGQLQAVLAARDRGAFPGDVEKTWITAYDERPCDLCLPLDGETVPVDQAFSWGGMRPPFHVQCRCDATYRVIRA